MIGNAYSADSANGYGYILIKSYDCDDMTFVNTNTPFQLFRVDRRNFSVELLHSGSKESTRHLRYESIVLICRELINCEFKSGYPVNIAWTINPSGIVEIKSAEDYVSQWPLTPGQLEGDVGYINLTDVFADGSLLYLKSSFIAEVINEAAFLCGICIGDLVIVIGDEIYGTLKLAHLGKYLFKCDSLYSAFNKIEKIRPVRLKSIKRRKILGKIKRLNIKCGCDLDFQAMELYLIKAECISDIVKAFEGFLKNANDVGRLIKQMKMAFNAAFEKLSLQKENFVFYSGGKNAADMNYLTFNDLMMTYSFGNFKNEMSEKIRTNRKRKHILKELEAPKVIYKGKLFFNY